MKTSADFLRGLADGEYTLSRDVRERLREIAQEMDDVSEIHDAVADLLAYVEVLRAKSKPAPSSSPTEPFSLPPVDPLEAITPTYQPDVPPSPPAQERL